MKIAVENPGKIYEQSDMLCENIVLFFIQNGGIFLSIVVVEC
jgi:hypothetical protein